jgi:hypothetical protein
MTKDITRGLALLAEQAEPAPIDSHAVIATVKARKRNRRAVATAFASVAAIGALTMTLGTDRATDTSAERNRAERLTAQLAAALPEVIPARWRIASTPPTATYAPRTFHCNPVPDSTPAALPGQKVVYPIPGWCTATSWYRDAEGEIELLLQAADSKGWTPDSCATPDCDERTLPDGTLVQVSLDTAGRFTPETRMQWLMALRPDGTYVNISTRWRNNRSTPPLTVDELVEFATALNYF